MDSFCPPWVRILVDRQLQDFILKSWWQMEMMITVIYLEKPLSHPPTDVSRQHGNNHPPPFLPADLCCKIIPLSYLYDEYIITCSQRFILLHINIYNNLFFVESAKIAASCMRRLNASWFSASVDKVLVTPQAENCQALGSFSICASSQWSSWAHNKAVESGCLWKWVGV